MNAPVILSISPRLNRPENCGVCRNRLYEATAIAFLKSSTHPSVDNVHNGE